MSSNKILLLMWIKCYSLYFCKKKYITKVVTILMQVFMFSVSNGQQNLNND